MAHTDCMRCSYFNGSSYTSKLQSEGFLAGDALGYRAVVAGQGGTGFATARTAAPPAPDFVTQVKQGALSVQQGSVSLVVVEGGRNDRGKPRQEIRDGATAVLTMAAQQHPGSKLVLVGPLAPDGLPDPETQAVVTDLQAVAQAQLVPFVDASAWLTPDQAASIIGPDHIHPTVAGHQELSHRLQAALREVGVPAG